MFLVGGFQMVEVPHRGVFPAVDYREGALLVAGLMSILVAHEMGHYLAARYHGVDATLPFFIPFPIPGLSLVGTLGAFIRIRSPFPNRRVLFDIGVAGPLAGFLVCLPVLWLGIGQATVKAPAEIGAGGLHLGEPLLFRWVTALVLGPIPEDASLVLGSLGLAAWFGLLVTALNLMPIGQLDGGHILYALFRERAHRLSRIGSWLAVALLYLSPSWLLWAILVRVLGRHHPPTLRDDLPLGWPRTAVAVLAAAVFVVCFVPEPIVFTWGEFFESLRALLRAVGLLPGRS